MKEQCNHKNTRKLFWLNAKIGKWNRTNFSICLDCGKIVEVREVEDDT